MAGSVTQVQPGSKKASVLKADERSPRVGLRRNGPLEGQLAVAVVEALYVILLGFLFARLVYTLITPLSTPAILPVSDAITDAADVAVISRYDPFFGDEPVVAQAAVQNVEETRLNLRLVGTFVTGDNPSATIQTEGGGQDHYYIDDEVINGVILKEVYVDQVIISRRGVTEALSLEGRERAPYTPVTARGTYDDGEADGGMMSQFVRMTPNASGSGFVLQPGSNRMVFEAAGLVDGDILTSVNGRPLPQGVSQAQGSLLRLLSRGPVTITINRAGISLDLVLDPTGLQP